MANRKKRLPSNVDGDFYVDMTCIDCGVCRWMAPDTFDRVRKQSRVYRQPRHPWDIRAAELALLACPTASIGTQTRHDLKPAASEFPLLIEDGVYTALDANTLDRVRDAGMEVRLLEPDVAARGVGERLPGSLGLVDYAGFVALVCDTDKTVAWF